MRKFCTLGMIRIGIISEQVPERGGVATTFPCWLQDILRSVAINENLLNAGNGFVLRLKPESVIDIYIAVLDKRVWRKRK